MPEQSRILRSCISRYLEACGTRTRSAQGRAANVALARVAPIKENRDPSRIFTLVDDFVREFDHNKHLTHRNIGNIWPEIVGDFGAKNTHPVEITRTGELIVSCLSRAIALSFRVYSKSLLDRLNDRYPELGLEKIVFVPPESKRGHFGPRSIRNADKHYE